MLIPMAKIEIIGPRSRFHEVLETLHEHGQLHIEDLSKKIDAGELPLRHMDMEGEDASTYEDLDDLGIRVRAVLKTLREPEGGVDPVLRATHYDRLWELEPDEMVRETGKIIDEVEEKTADLAELATALESEKELLTRYEPILQKIQPLAKQIVVTGAFDSVALLVERRYKVGLESLKLELSKLCEGQCEIISTDVDEDTTAAIVVFGRKYADTVHKFLSVENVNQIRLPEEFKDMPMDAAYESLLTRQKELPQELATIRAQLHDLSDLWYTELVAARDALNDRTDELRAVPQFGRTEYAFIITGWTPVSALKDFKSFATAKFGPDIIIHQLEIDEHEFQQTPVAFKNPKAVQPFEGLLAFRGTPMYGTYDPTFLLAIFYPILFGMIVGDIGYGLIYLLGVIWLRRKFKDNAGVQMATGILGPAATLAIAFGFLYGEFFGNLLHAYIIPIQIGPITLPFNRIEGMQQFLVIAIAVGFIQVVLGLAVGIANGIRTKHWSHVWEKGGILAFLLGLVVIIVAVLLVQSNLWVQLVGGALLLAGLIAAFRGGKLIGIIESIGALTNVASYARVMAVGLAGAIFADAANSMIAILGPFFGILLAIPLQLLNLVIAAFSPNIHAVRLNFLEFFGKFYETGETKYRPFQKSGGEKSA